MWFPFTSCIVGEALHKVARSGIGFCVALLVLPGDRREEGISRISSKIGPGVRYLHSRYLETPSLGYERQRRNICFDPLY